MSSQSKRSKLEKSSIIAQCDTLLPPTPSSQRIVDKGMTCLFFIERKNRHCNSSRIGESQYCVEHSGFLQEQYVRKRIPCPYDGSHSCYEDNLEKHLRKCPKRPELRPIYHKEAINSGEIDEPCREKVSIRSVEVEEIQSMIEKIKQIFNDHVKDVTREVLFHPVLEEEWKNPKNGLSAQKHIGQQASLIGLMEKHGLLEDHTCFAEFGAGKGGLSHWIQKAVHSHSDTQFVLIDKGCVRYKLDNFHKGDHQGPTFQRIKIDIEHLDINKVPNFENDRAIVCTGKHLCGGATDFMLRCTMAYKPKGEDYKSFMKGVTLALCCHHRCDWKSYVGKEFLRSCGMTSRHFQLLCGITSWATCASKHVPNDKEGEVQKNANAGSYNHFRYGDLLPQEREEIGNMAKNIIDWGRVTYLRQFGYTAELVQYVDKESTLENVCLIADLSKDSKS